ncbi:MAG: glycosyltransferase 87 family protein [Gordonia sp. (in: high G+C Gram-positive bacteria)]|uniref:glycosyltransferase 87 family protein n=1 Tax=Gordonia sp. (in: high G+C Gram-positive bacteria) TaxID=84139 RepID=UPI0039E327D1
MSGRNERFAPERLRTWRPGPVAFAVAALAFAASTVLQISGVPFTSSFGTRTRFDFDVYRLGGQLWHHGISLYADGSLPFTQDGIWLPFTYPPFAALVFTPLGQVGLDVGGILISIVSAVCLAYSMWVVLRALRVGTSRGRIVLALWISAIAVWFNPFGMTLGFGQINIILMALILTDVFVIGRRRSDEAATPLRGVLTGLSAAIKLTPLVFLAVFASAGRWRAFWTGLAAFVAAAGVAWAWLPADSKTYWTDTVFHTTRIGVPEGPINQNLNGSWLRIFGVDNPAAPAAWVLSSLVVTGLAVLALISVRPVAAFAPGADARDDVDAVLVVSIVAFWGLLVSPTTWAHHWVWALPAILACIVVAARSRDLTTVRLYAGLAATGIAIFAIGPFQLMPHDVTTWSWWQHLIGDAYVLWALAFLTIVWRYPFRQAAVPAAGGVAAGAAAG